MPIYEYTCQSCDKRFEKLVRSMSGKEKIVCPECGSGKTVREMSVFAGSSGQQPACGAGSASHAAGCSCCSGNRGNRSCPMDE